MIFLALLSLVLLCHSISGQNAVRQSSMYIPSSECMFYYSLNRSSGFIFYRCKNSDSENINNWISCLDECCGGGQSAPSYDAISECQKYDSSVRRLIIIIAVVTAVSCLLPTLGCYLIIAIFRLCCHKDKNKTVPSTGNNPEDVAQWGSEEVNSDCNRLLWSSKAREEDLSTINKRSDVCSICLDDRTSAMLVCGHSYHPQCIGAWLFKHVSCPSCREERIQRVKVYCQMCRWRYMLCSIPLVSGQAQNLPAQCLYCLQKKPRKQSSQQLLNNSKFMLDFSRKQAQGQHAL